MKKTRKLVTLVVAIITVFVITANPTSAAYYDTGILFANQEGGFLGVGATTYVYKVYKDSSSWYTMFHSLDVCPAIYHSKYGGTTTLTYSVARTYTAQNSYSFSSSVGATVGISELVGLTANATNGQTQSYSYSVAATGTVGRTIPSTASTGYYKMTICYNFDKFKLAKYYTNGTPLNQYYYPCLPKGNAYVSVLYGTTTNNSSYSKY